MFLNTPPIMRVIMYTNRALQIHHEIRKARSVHGALVETTQAKAALVKAALVQAALIVTRVGRES